MRKKFEYGTLEYALGLAAHHAALDGVGKGQNKIYTLNDVKSGLGTTVDIGTWKITIERIK